jgi:type IV pilus assembly protein PilN
MRVNLIRKEKKTLQFDIFRIAVTLGIIIPILVVAFLQYSLITERNMLQNEITRIEQDLDFYLPKEEEYKEFKSIVDQLKATPTVPEYNWDGPIEALGYLTPLRGTIDSFSLSSKSLDIRGRTMIGEELREFRQNLINSPYFVNVNLDTMEKQEVVSFVITADLADIEEGE